MFRRRGARSDVPPTPVESSGAAPAAALAEPDEPGDVAVPEPEHEPESLDEAAIGRLAQLVGEDLTGPPAAPAPVTDPEALQDERLIRAAQRGELASFNALVVRHE